MKKLLLLPLFILWGIYSQAQNENQNIQKADKEVSSHRRERAAQFVAYLQHVYGKNGI
ncbi:MAG: hypothetical protein ABIP79_15905 [Chitinophagaceae bacterium]